MNALFENEIKRAIFYFHSFKGFSFLPYMITLARRCFFLRSSFDDDRHDTVLKCGAILCVKNLSNN